MPLHRLALKSVTVIGIDNPEVVLRGPYSISPRHTATSDKKTPNWAFTHPHWTNSSLVTLTKDHPLVIVPLLRRNVQYKGDLPGPCAPWRNATANGAWCARDKGRLCCAKVSPNGSDQPEPRYRVRVPARPSPVPSVWQRRLATKSGLAATLRKGAEPSSREATPTPPHSLSGMWVPPLLCLACCDEAFTPGERVYSRRAEGRMRETEAGAAAPCIVVTSRVIINCACRNTTRFFLPR